MVRMSSDPFQMAMIHRTFRTEFGNLPGLIQAVAPGDTKRSKEIGHYLVNMMSVMHHHHAAEDDILWPKLRARVPNCDEHIQRTERQHAAIAESLNKAQSLQPMWQRSADKRSGEQLSAAVDGLSANITEHFADEEQNIVPLIRDSITAEEWQAFIDRGAAYVNPRNVWFALAYAGFLLRDATLDEQHRFVSSVPLGLRIVLKLFGRRAFDTYNTKLYGTH
jgi:hemerythrin-like domain-containing protein